VYEEPAEKRKFRQKTAKTAENGASPAQRAAGLSVMMPAAPRTSSARVPVIST
jgi:hypothetical protein